MGDAALAVLAVAVLGALALAALLAVTVAPLLVALAAADRRQASLARVTTAVVAGCVLALGGALLAVRAAGLLAAVPVLLLAWVAPVAVARAPLPRWLLGSAGRHERVR